MTAPSTTAAMAMNQVVWVNTTPILPYRRPAQTTMEEKWAVGNTFTRWPD
jgi:hypothetical protein